MGVLWPLHDTTKMSLGLLRQKPRRDPLENLFWDVKPQPGVDGPFSIGIRVIPWSTRGVTDKERSGGV